MERDFAAHLFTLFCPLFTSGASFSIAHEYSLRKVNFTYVINITYLLISTEILTNSRMQYKTIDPQSEITRHIAESSQAKHTRLSWSEDSLERSTLDTAVFKILKQKIVQQQRITVDLIQHCAISSHRSRQHQNFLKKAYVQLLKHIDATRQY